MKKLGTVKNVIHDGTILLSTSGTAIEGTPLPGARVYDSRGTEVGRVARVFGPVKEPYISLKPKGQIDVMNLLGAALYLNPEEPPVSRRPRAESASFNRRRSVKGPSGYKGKKGVNKWQRKEKPRKK